MRFEAVFGVVISITDIRYPMSNGARYGPGLALFGEIVIPGCIKLRVPAHGFGKSHKMPLFLQNTADIRFKRNAHRSVWRADLPQYGHNVAECGNAVKRGFLSIPYLSPRSGNSAQHTPRSPQFDLRFPILGDFLTLIREKTALLFWNPLILGLFGNWRPYWSWKLPLIAPIGRQISCSINHYYR
jgi:hypothetical protein